MSEFGDLRVSGELTVPAWELSEAFVRASGPGGQNVNKVASAIHLRFDIGASSLPALYKQRLLALRDHRITNQGVIIIKAQQYRNQEPNREEALRRLTEIIKDAMRTRKQRQATKPSRNSQRKRMDSKSKHGRNKALRKKINPE